MGTHFDTSDSGLMNISDGSSIKKQCTFTVSIAILKSSISSGQ
jgi:hypothetical protein